MIKSKKGYSLIEIGVGILMLTVFLIVSIGLFSGCYNNYRRIKQRNIAVDRAIYYLENMLQTDSDTLTGYFIQTLDENTNTYSLAPNNTFKTFVSNNFSDYKLRYASYKKVSEDSIVGVPTGKDLEDYIFEDREYLINDYIKYDAINKASATQLMNGSYGFLEEDGRFAGDVYEIVINNETTDTTYDYVTSNGGAFRVVKTISRIPSTSGKAYGNNVLRLKVDVYYARDFSNVITDDNLDVITIETIKL